MNKKVIISGVTRGLGFALAETFASQGFDVAGIARDKIKLKEVFEDLSKRFPKAGLYMHSADLGEEESCIKASKKIREEFGFPDVLINNVGQYVPDTLTGDGTIFKQMMRTNFESALYLTKPFIHDFKDRGSGHIVNIGSVLSKSPRADAASYTMSKYALKGFNDVLREEMRPFGVKVTSVLPGSINTSSWDGMDVPKEKFVQPSDIAFAIFMMVNYNKHTLVEELVMTPLDKSL